MNPKVTIILATYNRAHLVVETLRSIQQQTYRDFECLMIDDGCTDGTEEVIRPFLEDHRFNYFKRNGDYKKGLPGCRNYGLDRAGGEYIIFFDDDDIVHPQNLEVCSTMLAQETVDFVAYQKKSFVEDVPRFEKVEAPFKKERVASKSIIEEVLTQHRPLASCTVMWTKEAIGEERFNEVLHYAEEWEFYTRLLSKEIQGMFLDGVLYFNRKHSSSNTGKFFSGNSTLRQSKSEAILCVTHHLRETNLLSKYLLDYFLGLAISYRNTALLKKLLEYRKIPENRKMYFRMKYDLFPLFRFWKKVKRKLGI